MRIYSRQNPPDYNKALDVYHDLKNTYRRMGNSDAASYYYELEMDCKRQNLQWFTKNMAHLFLVVDLWLWRKTDENICFFLCTILRFATIYVLDGGPTPETNNFPEALYFSVVTFTSLGYGDIFSCWDFEIFRGNGAFDWCFMISLFCCCFHSKNDRLKFSSYKVKL